MSVSWIPINPDDYLHPDHHHRGHHLPDDWQLAHARWRHCYTPGFRKLANDIFPNTNCAAFQSLIEPFIPAAKALIPLDLKSAINNNNPQDWAGLPDRQIRYIWDNEAALFSKIALAMVCLQIAILIKDEKIEGYSIWRDNKLTQHGDDPSTGDLAEKVIALGSLDDSVNVFQLLSMYPAVFRLVNFDSQAWKQLFKDEDKLHSFRSHTRQTHPAFSRSYAKGHLVTLPTTWAIGKWINEHAPEFSNTRWAYFHQQRPRVKAAEKELVAHYPRDVSLDPVDKKPG